MVALSTRLMTIFVMPLKANAFATSKIISSACKCVARAIPTNLDDDGTERSSIFFKEVVTTPVEICKIRFKKGTQFCQNDSESYLLEQQ